MKSMNISLPDSMRTYIKSQIVSGSYSSASEYFRQLVRADDQKRQANERLEALLLEGLESGTATPMTEQDWLDMSQSVRLATAKRAGSIE